MNPIKTLIALALLAPTFTIHAQDARVYATSLNGGTNNVAATATNTYAISIPCSEHQYTGLTIEATPSASSTGSLLFRISKAIVPGEPETVPSAAALVTFKGTGAVRSYTSIDTGGAAVLYITAGENTNAAYATNIVVKYRPKQTRITAR